MNKHIRRDNSPISADVSLALYVDDTLTSVVVANHCHKHGLGYHKDNGKKHYATLEEIELEMLGANQHTSIKLKTFEEIHEELLRLTELRKQIVKTDNSTKNFFTPDTNAPTFSDLEKAVSALEGHTLPYFDVYYVEVENVYCLVTRPKRS